MHNTDLKGREVEIPSASADHFDALALPPHLVVDQDALEKTYLNLSRTLHPDYNSETDQATVVAASAALNNGYQTLKDTVLLAKYWLARSGVSLHNDDYKVPPALAMRVFEVQEKLEQLGNSTPDPSATLESDIEDERTDITSEIARLTDGIAGVFTKWDEIDPDKASDHPELAQQLKDAVSQINYLTTLIRDIDRARSKESA